MPRFGISGDDLISKRHIVQMMTCVLFNFNVFNLKIAWFPRTGFIYPALNCYSCPFSIGACPFGTLQKSTIELREGISSLGIFQSILLFPFYLIGSLIIFGIIFGRAVCGWLCPFGFLQDIFGNFSVKDRIPEKVDKKLRFLKYFIFIAALVLAAIFLDTMFCKLCPAATIFAAVSYRILFGQGATTIWYIVRIFLFAGLILGLLILARRFWCRYLCPIGAFLGLFNKISLIKIKINKELCSGCRFCSKNCPMGVKVYEDYVSQNKQSIDSRECIKCGTCSKNCPTKALNLALK